MTGQFIVAEIKEHYAVEGADRIVSSVIFGETIITTKTTAVGTKGILIDCESQLSEEVCHRANLYRHSHLNADQTKKGYIEDNRRVKPIALKGVKCSALFLSEEALNEVGIFNLPEIGTQDNELDGIPICTKYISKKTHAAKQNSGGKVSVNLVPTFKEHISTDQWARNKKAVRGGNLVVLTDKLHGTSCRAMSCPVIRTKPWWEKLVNILGIKTVETEYRFTVGSRKVVKSIEGEKTHKGGYYDTDVWSTASERFKGKLLKGECVYFEIVGFLPTGPSIMPSQSNVKLKPFMDKKEYKEFIANYGEETVFSYGCDENQHEVYVYRITRTNEDADSIDMSWDGVKRRCEELNVRHVPELLKDIVKEDEFGDMLLRVNSEYENIDVIINDCAEQSSKIFPQHLREGVVVRIDNGTDIPIFLKHKSFIFKVLEGIIKETDTEDLEEIN